MKICGACLLLALCHATQACAELSCQTEPLDRNGPISVYLCIDRLGDSLLRFVNDSKTDAVLPVLRGCEILTREGKKFRTNWRLYPIEPMTEWREYEIFRSLGGIASAKCEIESAGILERAPFASPAGSAAITGSVTRSKK